MGERYRERRRQGGPVETALRARSPPRLKGVGGLHFSLLPGRVTQEELMKLSSYRHTETVTDDSGEKAGVGTRPIGQGRE